MEQWCSRWEPGEDKTAKLTRLLIKDLKSWYGRSHGEVTFTLTQVLSGHGCFRHYLYIRKLSACAGCIYGDAEDDTAKHTVMECKRWSREREEVLRTLGLRRLTPENLVPIMLKGQAEWDAISSFIDAVMVAKEIESRQKK